ncbi:MAG TPA: hypothetical protein DFS52_30290 [Myxococcales bacterium]|jgi:hypothetical protein|nr:hypothetical protein [Myxococcales bacterium]
MRKTVLWEDQRGALIKGFGPHELLIRCLADRSGAHDFGRRQHVESIPLKGVSNLIKRLKQDAQKLRDDGPVFAVIDRDKIRDQLSPKPPDCMKGLSRGIRTAAPGDYEIVFLVQNVESLLDAVIEVLDLPRRAGKPTPDERDRMFQKAKSASRAKRDAILDKCPSFKRLVSKVLES